jgi:pyrroloquinoline quinone biosynthesis protein D
MSCEAERPTPPGDTRRPRLSSRARLEIDHVSQQRVVLYPEGILLLNETAAAILRLCDGRHTLEELLAELAQRYALRPEQLRADVYDYLERLQEYNLIELS